MAASGRFSTPSSGRKWKSRRTEEDEAIPAYDESAGGEDAAMINAMFPEAGHGEGGGSGGGDGGGDGGGRRDLTTTMMEEQMKEMFAKMKTCKSKSTI